MSILSELTKDDYDNIFTFYSTINSDYSNYENIVMFSLYTILKIRLAAYFIFRIESDGSKKLEQIYSTRVRKEVYNQYKREYFICDPFLQNYSQLCYKYPNTAYFTDEHLEEFGGLQNSKYSNLLRSYNIAHEAIIGVNGSPGSLVQIIRVYRTKEDGAFTLRDKEMFQFIGQAFNDSKTLYSRFLHEQRKQYAISALFDELLFGFAILDEKGHFLFNNSAFMSLSINLSFGLSKAEIVKDIISAVTGTEKLPEENFYQEVRQINGLTVTLQKKRMNLSNKPENLFFIILQKEKDEYDPKMNIALLSSRYGLTRREAEVAQLAAKGYNNQEIANELFLGISTVKTYICGIYSKMMVNSRTEMMKKLHSDEKQK